MNTDLEEQSSHPPPPPRPPPRPPTLGITNNKATKKAQPILSISVSPAARGKVPSRPVPIPGQESNVPFPTSSAPESVQSSSLPNLQLSPPKADSDPAKRRKNNPLKKITVKEPKREDQPQPKFPLESAASLPAHAMATLSPPAPIPDVPDSFNPILEKSRGATVGNLKNLVTLFRVRLPNGSHRTFPVDPSTTTRSILDKLITKMQTEKLSDQDWSESRIFLKQHNDEIRLEDDDNVFELLQFHPPGCEFIFKREGEKEVDVLEELKLIERTNRDKDKRKETLQEAYTNWITENKKNKPAITLFSDKRYFPPISATTDRDTQITMLQDKLLDLEEDLFGFTKRVDSIKKTKLRKNCSTVDFSKVRILSLLVESTSNGSSVYRVMVDGWQCVMKQVSIINRTVSPIKLFNELSLLESLPAHENIIQ